MKERVTIMFKRKRNWISCKQSCY